MPRVTALGPIFIGTAILTGFSLLVLRLIFRASAGPLVLAAFLVGTAAFLVGCVIFRSFNRDARELRRRVENLLGANRNQRVFTPDGDEMGALASSLEVAARQVERWWKRRSARVRVWKRFSAAWWKAS